MSTRMAANSRPDLASSIPEASILSSSFLNGQRGSNAGGNLERPGSVRESMDTRAFSSTAIPSIEIPPPSSFLTTIQLSLGEQKYPRTAELRRVFGISPEENSFRSFQCKPLSPTVADELKRFKASVIETASRARERTRVFLDSSTKVERYRKLILKKRQRTGGQSHQNPSDLVAQRHEDRAKSIPPNKRVRSSMGEMRAEGRFSMPPKDQNTIFDKDKNTLKACNGVSVLATDKMRTFPSGGEACENKTRKKRSVGTVGNRLTDGDRETKGSVQRLNNETRPRNSNGPAYSGIIPRDGLEDLGPSSDIKERPAAIDKELNPPKGGNKCSIHENAQIGGPRSFVKGKSFRGPRSTSSSSLGTSPSFRHTFGLSDTPNEPPILNKVHQISETISRKLPLSEWGGQRPPKNTRTKRMNVLSPISNHDDVSSPADGHAQIKSTSNTHQVKLKFGAVTSPVYTPESNGPMAFENKSKEKVLSLSGEMEEGVMSGVQKVASSMLPTKKNKFSSSGRGGRTGISSTKQRIETADLSKLPRSGKPVLEIRACRPPLRKASDRKASNRSVGFCEQIDESYNDHDELAAAANLARNARCQSCSSPFWKEMDRFFSLISEENLAFLKEQMKFAEEVDLSLCGQSLMGDLFHKIPDSMDEEKWFRGIFPLSQMILAAFIIEKETEIYYDDHYNDGNSFPTGDDDTCQYDLDDRILMELRNVDLFPDPVVGIAAEGEEIDEDLQELKMQLYEQIRTRKRLLRQLIKSVEAEREAEERMLEQTAMDKLVELAYKKYLRGRGGQKSGANRVSRQVAQAFAQRVLTRCHQFEATGLSCFSDAVFRTIIPVDSSNSKAVDAGHLSVQSSKMQAQKAHQEPCAPVTSKNMPERYPSHEAATCPSTSPTAPLITPFSSSTKGKRSERDRDHTIAKPRTSLTKPNRKAQTTNDHNNNSNNNSNSNKPKQKNRVKEEDAVDFINLPLDSIDGLGEQAHDLGTWLSLDDVNLQDDDLMMGLEIPMDDLSELNMSMNF